MISKSRNFVCAFKDVNGNDRPLSFTYVFTDDEAYFQVTSQDGELSTFDIKYLANEGWRIQSPAVATLFMNVTIMLNDYLSEMEESILFAIEQEGGHEHHQHATNNKKAA